MSTYSRGILLLLLLLICFLGHSQTETYSLTGKVQNGSNDVSNVLVVNLASKKSTITDTLGLFTIEVKLRDSLRFSALQYIPKKITVTDSVLYQKMIIVELVENVINLDEVMVTPYNLTGHIDSDIKRLHIEPTVNSSTLGLPNANLQGITQGERLLLEADRGKFVRLATIEDQGKIFEVLGYASLTVIINTHKILNRVSGRTQNLRGRVNRDEDLLVESNLITLFSRETLSEGLGIPRDKMNGFLTYCLSQSDFSTLSEKPDTLDIWEYLRERSDEFKETGTFQK